MLAGAPVCSTLFTAGEVLRRRRRLSETTFTRFGRAVSIIGLAVCLPLAGLYASITVAFRVSGF